MPRLITNHVVSGDPNGQLTIQVKDEPGQDGACHLYCISGMNPNSGPLYETHVNVHFQEGPIQEAGVNGVTQEALLAIVIDRLKSFQAGPYPSPFNASALVHCEQALNDLQQRTRNRIARGVEGRTKA